MLPIFFRPSFDHVGIFLNIFKTLRRGGVGGGPGHADRPVIGLHRREQAGSGGSVRRHCNVSRFGGGDFDFPQEEE